jgi:MurNAc alpha-1-phosphate uridylyltransferase
LENNLINRKDKENLKYIYTGIQILTSNAFDHLNLKAFSINKIWDRLIRNSNLFGMESNVNFLHVSTINVYNRLLEKYFKH